MPTLDRGLTSAACSQGGNTGPFEGLLPRGLRNIVRL